jgi:haloalkane dehalogenase
VIPELSPLGRCVAPDLIGMGDSDKLPSGGADRYAFARHREFLDAFIDEVVGTEPVTLVIHDWGSALGFDWARRHPDRVRGIAYMEAFVRPVSGWEDWPEPVRDVFRALRSPAGDQMVLAENLFVEAILPQAVLRELREDEMDEYRRPFAAPGEDRRPMLTWARQIPIGGEPADVDDAVAAYASWLSASDDLPKLLINADPGVILGGERLAFCRRWPNQTEVTVPGLHFLQEDSGPEIGRAIASWLTA